MLRKRLTVALALLALAAVLEGFMALWALNVAAQHLERGRVVGDIQLGFVELSVTKQRLRTWVSQRQLDAGAQPAERDRLLQAMRSTLAQLQALAQRAAALDLGADTPALSTCSGKTRCWCSPEAWTPWRARSSGCSRCAPASTRAAHGTRSTNAST